MNATPFIVFVVCAGIAGYAASSLVYAGQIVGRGLLPDLAAFLLVFFGLASLAVPVLIAIRSKAKADQ